MAMTPTKETILFIEDDPTGREVGLFNLRKAGYRVDEAGDGDEGLRLFSPDRHDLVITDVRMPGLSGLEVLDRIKARSPDVPVLVVTAYGNVELAVQAMKAGAHDFIGKPFNRDHLLLTVKKALESRQLKREVRDLRRRARGIERPLVYRSQLIGELTATVDRVAPSDATVLLLGESGTGKELVARRLHARSNRSEGPFVAVNCAALPSELLESELFGHVKGAFTGADRDRRGRFRQANQGTVFLDEIGDLPAAVQAKLLRVLQERTVDVLGGDEPTAVDVRIVAATNQDLRERVGLGAFREDLYYRLSVVELTVPPLRDRPEDIAPLVEHFVEHFGPGRELQVSTELLAELEARSWPGNVRELQNVCERLVLLTSTDSLSPQDLPPRTDALHGPGRETWPPLPEEGFSLIELEQRIIERVLEHTKGNISQAARYLRVPRHILTYRLEKYGLRRPG